MNISKSKKKEGNFKASTIELEWKGKTYRVSQDVADAIKKRKDYKSKVVKKTKSK